MGTQEAGGGWWGAGGGPTSLPQPFWGTVLTPGMGNVELKAELPRTALTHTLLRMSCPQGNIHEAKGMAPARPDQNPVRFMQKLTPKTALGWHLERCPAPGDSKPDQGSTLLVLRHLPSSSPPLLRLDQQQLH